MKPLKVCKHCGRECVNTVCDDCARREWPTARFFIGVRNGCLFSLPLWALIAVVAVSCSGCSTVRPLAEYQHVSHATQHFGSDRTNYGYDMGSVGIRWRPLEGVTVDLLEGYAVQEIHGRHEVFTGRMTVEF